MPSVDTLHPDDRVKAFQIAERRRNKDFSTIDEVLRMLTKSGEIRECETSSTLIEFEGSWAIFFTSHDITENKKNQRALLESEKKYRELTEMLPQTVYELDANGDIIYFNETGFKQFGIDKTDIGTSSYRFIAPEQHEQLKLNIQKTLTKKKITFGNKYTAVRKNGETFPAMTFAGPIIYEDKVSGVRGIILDMSEHEAMENALKESEEKYRTLIDKATDGIVITQNGLIKFANPAMCTMMKYPLEELLENPYLNFVVAEDHAVMVDFHKRRMAGEQFTSIYRSRFIPKDGKIITMELNARTSDYNGKPAAFIIIRNITERLNIEKRAATRKN